jgi:ferritin-like metal-binding protein YciE
MTGYVFANVEIPAYTSLIAVAEAADHGETKRVGTRALRWRDGCRYVFPT